MRTMQLNEPVLMPVWMIIVTRMRVLVLVVMGRIMGGRVQETIR